MELPSGAVGSCEHFVYPAWFDDSTPPGAACDSGGLAPGPFAVAPTGYVTFRDEAGQATQRHGELAPPVHRLVNRRRTGKRLGPGWKLAARMDARLWRST